MNIIAYINAKKCMHAAINISTLQGVIIGWMLEGIDFPLPVSRHFVWEGNINMLVGLKRWTFLCFFHELKLIKDLSDAIKGINEGSNTIKSQFVDGL